THFRTLFRGDGFALVEASPKTGRLHQVRRHLKHLSHPVLGDANYGKGALNRAYRERHGLARLALHAVSLTLEVEGASRTFRAPLPPALARPFGALGIPRDLYE